MASPEPTAAALEKLLHEQRQSWQAGERVLVESLVERHPDLAADPQILLDLIYGELCLCDECGHAADEADYARRFPRLAHDLGPLFELHRSLREDLTKPFVASPPKKSNEPELAIPGGTVTELLHKLADIGVLTERDLRSLLAAHHRKRFASTRALVDKLLELRKVTRFQLHTIARGQEDYLRIADYVLVDRLGSGGMGQVFRAMHRHMERLVAIKLLPADHQDNEVVIKRFQREVRAAARLVHPNIVQAYDAGLQNGSWFLVMEYVDGSNLSAIVKRRGPLPVTEALGYLLQAARGLAYAHAAGVIHRDIKPANLLIDGYNTVKVIDMGLARIEGAVHDNLTGANSMIGTPQYMAPEQLMDPKNVDHRADIYSLGCTLWYMLIGTKWCEIAHKNAALKPPQQPPKNPLGALRSDIPPRLEQLFQTLIAPLPADRCANMMQVVAALEQILVSLGVSMPDLDRSSSGIMKLPRTTEPSVADQLASSDDADPSTDPGFAQQRLTQVSAEIEAHLSGATERAADGAVPNNIPRRPGLITVFRRSMRRVAALVGIGSAATTSETRAKSDRPN